MTTQRRIEPAGSSDQRPFSWLRMSATETLCAREASIDKIVSGKKNASQRNRIAAAYDLSPISENRYFRNSAALALARASDLVASVPERASAFGWRSLLLMGARVTGAKGGLLREDTKGIRRWLT